MSIKFGNDYSRRYCVGYLDLFDQMSDLEKEKKLIYAEKNMTEIAAATAVSNGCWSEWSIAKIEESPTEESQRFIEIEIVDKKNSIFFGLEDPIKTTIVITIEAWHAALVKALACKT